MNVKHYFDTSRFWLLLKMELFRSRKAIVMTLVTLFGLMFFVRLLLYIIVGETKTVYEHDNNFTGSLLIGGFILSSLAFNDLSNTLRRYHYLTLPASTFEKFLCMWLLTSFGWIGLFTICFTIYTFIANPIGHLLFRYITFVPFRPLEHFATNSMITYFVLQGIFMIGAVRFKGYALPKTLFAIVVFALLTGILAYFIMRGSFLIEHECTAAGDCEIVREIQLHPAWQLIEWIFRWLLAPLCWTITYLGLKEKEI